MTNQHEGVHARVFRGINAERKVVQLRKRDNLHQFIHQASHNTNGEKIKLNVPEGFTSGTDAVAAPKFANKQQDDTVETVYSVVYQTVSDPAPVATSTVAATNVAQAGASSVAPAAVSSSAAPAATSATLNADEAAYASKQSAANAIPTTSSSSSAYPTRQFAPAATSSSAIPNPMSAATAATAASASVIGGTPLQNQAATAAVGSPLSQSHAAENTGMSGGAKAGVAFAVILALGLLAGLAFFCYRRRKNPKSHEEITNEKYNEKSGFSAAPKINRFSADSDKLSARSSNTPATAPRLSLRPVTQFLPNLSDKRQSSSAWERPQNKNPFADASEKQANPFAEGDGTDRTNSMSSTNSANSATAAAGGAPAARGPNNVHRVQLDFKPSMEDELELISGQLVRMLHEYDDGWALCIRMDRTQQGVVPRTCLSKLPVKPRGPPQSRPQGAPSNGPSPPSTANGMAPRPLTPTRERAGTIEGGVPARKPVPGMAM
nr:hypothetical protein B0A51_10973 [Rachicladosporium sp. CCFEE 5018]